MEALVFGGLVGAHVALQHADRGDGGITHRVLLAERSGAERAVRERGLQGVQQVHDDADELKETRTVVCSC